MSNGSCGSNSSTNRKKRSWNDALSSSHCRRRAHHLRPGEVRLLAEVRARVLVVVAPGRGDDGLADEAGVGARLPGVGLVAALVLPGVEVGVVVLAAGLEEMRVVGDEHRLHARTRAGARSAAAPTARCCPTAATGSPARRRGCRVAPACRAATRSSAGRTASPAPRTGRGSASRTRACRTRPACAGSGCRAG